MTHPQSLSERLREAPWWSVPTCQEIADALDAKDALIVRQKRELTQLRFICDHSTDHEIFVIRAALEECGVPGAGR